MIPKRAWSLAAALVLAASGSIPACALAASGPKPGGATYVTTALSTRLMTAPISDPTLSNMVAVTLTIPEGWKVQGVEMIPPCTPAPSPAFRAYSADGLMQLRQEPMLGWRWGTANQDGCARISGPISAADFLKYYVGMIKGGVHVVGPMAVAAGYAQAAQTLAQQFEESDQRLPPMYRMHHSAQTAALRVQVVNGSFLVEERVRTEVECGVKSTSQTSAGGSCFARTDVLSAPVGKLDALVRLVDENHLPAGKVNPAWLQATLQQLEDRNAAIGAQQLAGLRARSAAFSQMMYSAFQQNMARSASEHAAFMQQQESSFESSMNDANAAMNARSTAASDWVDYALDQQTVTGAGGTAKVSSAYSQTWSNGQGKYYQTNVPNANPNGVLQGNWTPTTVVHGNGQPR